MHLNFGDIIVFRCVEYHAISANGVTTITARLHKKLLGGEIPNAILLVEPTGAWSTDSCACAKPSSRISGNEMFSSLSTTLGIVSPCNLLAGVIVGSRGGPCQHGFMCGCKQWSNDINESN